MSQSGEPQFWLSHGYALVVGDVRGTGASFGVWRHHRSRDETLDFSEIVDGIIAQPWSDQQVVGSGCPTAPTLRIGWLNATIPR